MKFIQTAGGVVVNKKGAVVIVSNRGLSWSLPKGKMDPGETAFQTACREIGEESGIKDLQFVEELGVYRRHPGGPKGVLNKKEMRIIHIFLFRSDQKKLVPTDPHNPEARWVSKDVALDMLTHDKDRDFFESIMDLF